MLNLPEETLAAMKAQATRADEVIILRATTRFNSAQIDIKSGLLSIPQLPLELAFVESAMPVAETPSAPAAAPPPTPAPSKAIPTPSPSSQKDVSTGQAVTIDDIRTSFERVVRKIEPKNKTMAEALRQARLYKVDGNEVYFITFDFMKQRFDKPKPRAAIDEAFSEVLGQTVSVHFLSDSEASGGTSSLAARATDESDDQGMDENTDALLKVATEELGGEIVE